MMNKDRFTIMVLLQRLMLAFSHLSGMSVIYMPWMETLVLSIQSWMMMWLAELQMCGYSGLDWITDV